MFSKMTQASLPVDFPPRSTAEPIPAGAGIIPNTSGQQEAEELPILDQAIQIEISSICADTGALVHEATKGVQSSKNENIVFSIEEPSGIKKISSGHLCLLGLKPLRCLKEYYNLRPSTFFFPLVMRKLLGVLAFSLLFIDPCYSSNALQLRIMGVLLILDWLPLLHKTKLSLSVDRLSRLECT